MSIYLGSFEPIAKQFKIGNFSLQVFQEWGPKERFNLFNTYSLCGVFTL